MLKAEVVTVKKVRYTLGAAVPAIGLLMPTVHAAAVTQTPPKKTAKTVSMAQHRGIRPDTYGRCVESTDGDNSLCFTIFGSKAYVSEMVTRLCTPYGSHYPFGKSLHLEISGPKGYVRNNASFTLSKYDSCSQLSEFPRKDMPTGRYTAKEWWKILPGTYSNLAQTYVSVK
jgi:hypothetical protein